MLWQTIFQKCNSHPSSHFFYRRVSTFLYQEQACSCLNQYSAAGVMGCVTSEVRHQRCCSFLVGLLDGSFWRKPAMPQGHSSSPVEKTWGLQQTTSITLPVMWMSYRMWIILDPVIASNDWSPTQHLTSTSCGSWARSSQVGHTWIPDPQNSGRC